MIEFNAFVFLFAIFFLSITSSSQAKNDVSCRRQLLFELRTVKMGPVWEKKHCDPEAVSEIGKYCDITVRLSLSDKVVGFKHASAYNTDSHDLIGLKFEVFVDSAEMKLHVEFFDDDCRISLDTVEPYYCMENHNWCSSWQCPFLEPLGATQISVKNDPSERFASFYVPRQLRFLNFTYMMVVKECVDWNENENQIVTSNLDYIYSTYCMVILCLIFNICATVLFVYMKYDVVSIIRSIRARLTLRNKVFSTPEPSLDKREGPSQAN